MTGFRSFLLNNIPLSMYVTLYHDFNLKLVANKIEIVHPGILLNELLFKFSREKLIHTSSLYTPDTSSLSKACVFMFTQA
jgi:hypothetical protein